MARVFYRNRIGRSDLQVPLRYRCMILDLTVGDTVRELDTQRSTGDIRPIETHEEYYGKQHANDN
jgi:hypothetical protein